MIKLGRILDNKSHSKVTMFKITLNTITKRQLNDYNYYNLVVERELLFLLYIRNFVCSSCTSLHISPAASISRWNPGVLRLTNISRLCWLQISRSYYSASGSWKSNSEVLIVKRCTLSLLCTQILQLLLWSSLNHDRQSNAYLNNYVHFE